MCFPNQIKQIVQQHCAHNINISRHFSIFLLVALVQLLVLQQQMPHVLAASVTKGLTRMHATKIASIHGLQAAAESIPTSQQQHERQLKQKDQQQQQLLMQVAKDKKSHAAAGKPTKADADRTPAHVAGKYEIRSVAGEPNYKSVNLTWEVEFVPAEVDTLPVGAVTASSSDDVQSPKSFQVFFCELQSFGPHRCRSKLVDDETKHQSLEPVSAAVAEEHKHVLHYATQVENLRMATKYSFHIRPQLKRGNMKVTGRSEVFGNEIEDDTLTGTATYAGQTIIIPTKGFSAEATKCLPHASEIEVETGPYFGGKIVVDGGNCGVKGDPNDPADKYTMRIDHKMCGSLVKPETNTVETFITVQENLGIYTHSTRRFVVVCSFQSGMQTVRASFTVPGKDGVAAAVENDPFEPDERMGREQRQMHYVDKSALILKESDVSVTNRSESSVEESDAIVKEVPDPNNANSTIENRLQNSEDALEAVAILEDIIPGVNEAHIKHENEVLEKVDMAVPVAHTRLAKYAKLVVDPAEHETDGVAINQWFKLNNDEEGRALASPIQYITANLGTVALTICLSVIMIGIFMCVVYRELRRHRSQNGHSNMQAPPQPRNQHKRLPQSTLPRALQPTSKTVGVSK